MWATNIGLVHISFRLIARITELQEGKATHAYGVWGFEIIKSDG